MATRGASENNVELVKRDSVRREVPHIFAFVLRLERACR
jgi:hypothetical protein